MSRVEFYDRSSKEKARVMGNSANLLSCCEFKSLSSRKKFKELIYGI